MKVKGRVGNESEPSGCSANFVGIYETVVSLILAQDLVE